MEVKPMKCRAAILAFVLVSFLATGSCKKKEEQAPAEPPPAAVLSPPGAEKPQIREDAIKKQEYQEEMKERPKNRKDL